VSRSRARPPGPLAELAGLARRQGWTVTLNRRNHWRWKAPGGAVIFTENTPSDRRGWLNSRARLRAAGLRDKERERR